MRVGLYADSLASVLDRANSSRVCDDSQTADIKPHSSRSPERGRASLGPLSKGVE